MKKTYISPIVKVDMAEVADALLVTSIQMSDEPGNEEFVKEEAVGEDGWDIDWCFTTHLFSIGREVPQRRHLPSSLLLT